MQYYGLVILSLHIFILYNFLVLSEARTECFLIVGILRCPAHPDKVKGVKIDLVDEDSLPLEIDDIMGRTWSTTNGSFTVSGCGSDFGPLNTPDPFLQIDHLCPHRRTGITQQVQVDVIPIFLPRTINLGSIYLDRYLEDEVV